MKSKLDMAAWSVYINNRLDVMQKDINLLKARNDYLDLYALYNQLEKRMTELEKKVS